LIWSCSVAAGQSRKVMATGAITAEADTMKHKKAVKPTVAPAK
jgi:hypothetical protein